MEMIEKTVPDYSERVFYTCGPRPMVDATVAMLTEMGLPEARIKYEYFSGYLGAPSDGSTKELTQNKMHKLIL
jgi:ferredoxin-NADP reductase